MRVNVSHRQCLMNMATFSCENPCSVGFSTCLWAGIGMQHVFFCSEDRGTKKTELQLKNKTMFWKLIFQDRELENFDIDLVHFKFIIYSIILYIKFWFWFQIIGTPFFPNRPGLAEDVFFLRTSMPEECAKLVPLTPVIREGLASRQWLDMSTINKYMINTYIWVNYNDLTATSLEIMASKRNHPKIALFQVSELLSFTQIYVYTYVYLHMYIHMYIHSWRCSCIMLCS